MDFFAAAAFTCAHMCLSLLLTFSLKKLRNWVRRDPFSEEKLNLKGGDRHLDRRSPMFVEKCVLNLISHIQWNWYNHSGIYSKSWSSEGSQNQIELEHAETDANTAFTNIGERKLKWAITVRRLQISSKCNKICESKLTASPNTSSSECAIFR